MFADALRKGRDCSCGRPHRCSVESIVIEEGAFGRLKELCPEEEILAVADENTLAAAGEPIKAALQGKNCRWLVFPASPLLIPDEEAVAAVRRELKGAELLLAVGSGVIQDLCKYVAFFALIPYVVAATAPSMDGYASDGAAMILKGMKETVAAALPRAIAADTRVLCQAPMAMIRAGYGDVIGKYSALNDWKLSHLVNGEYFCPWICGEVERCVEAVRNEAEGLTRRREESVRLLMEALVTVGVMMSFAGSSRPASGSEHHLSHYFEIVGIVKGEDYYPHGIDVAYSTAVTARLRETLAAMPFPEKGRKTEKKRLREELFSLYGERVGEGCFQLQKKAQSYEKERLLVYRQKEGEIRSLLRECPTEDEILLMLEAVGLRREDFSAFYGEEKIARGVKYAKDLKDRYSVLWMNYDLRGGEL